MTSRSAAHARRDCPASVDVYRSKLAYLERHIAELRDVRDRLSDRGGAQRQANVAEVNVDENQGTAQRYGILAMPTLSVFRNGEIISQVAGARPKRRLLADLSALQRFGDERVGHGLGGGHGLGLAIVGAIAAAHGAELTASSRPAGGLDITVSFPLSRP
jgi:hypothetical protein